ncbi:glutathione S-transferase family protein [Leisingera sp. ANG59]|uniref:glutathione S-transferase family protein n=1 Tax=Leisingera sp. ANG59 TaxID=2675221 RepID=UPI00157240E8|nr:glutathione S-transferase N-terminal domain-containing protein [Leisingera sp. ANG59]NSY40628.1 glutathione S-transferase family protein [Leisingera sp. ANG59]
MITVYAASSPNVVKILLALEEMELAYEVKPVDVLAGAQFEPDFRKLSPNAKVPVIVDHADAQQEPVTVFESAAILLYLANKTGSFLQRDEASRLEELQWLMIQVSSIGPMFGQFMHFYRFAPSGNDYATARYRTQVVLLLDLLEARLAHSSWVGGADYGIVDMATFPWARSFLNLFGSNEEENYPKLREWVTRIADRPATARANAATEALARQMTAPQDSQPENLDRVFGRGVYALQSSGPAG